MARQYRTLKMNKPTVISALVHDRIRWHATPSCEKAYIQKDILGDLNWKADITLIRVPIATEPMFSLYHPSSLDGTLKQVLSQFFVDNKKISN